MRTLILSTLLTGLTGAAFAQVGGPFLGYLPDGPRLRSMYGLPAAGAIGAAIDAGRDFSHIAISPTQKFAVATAADTGEVLVVKPGLGNTSIKGASADPDMIAMSPGGTAAALWFPATGKLQAISGLPDAPTVRTIDASFLNSSPLSIAISDDGQWAAAIFSAGVYAFGPSSEVIPLQTDPGVVALAFFHNRHDLALASASRLTSIADVGGSTTTSVLYDYSAQSLSPRALAVSFDNVTAVLADSAGKIVSVARGAASISDCGCSPEGVYGLGGPVFRLTGSGAARSGPRTDLKLFDASTGAVLIVPPALSEKGGRQ
jgi:hypothetical protein